MTDGRSAAEMDRTYDAVILGGGVVGLFSAYYLSQSGASVCVLDQRNMGHGSSLHNAGYVSPSHFVPLAAPGMFLRGLKWMMNPVSPLYIKPRLDFSLVSWGARFALACREKPMRRAMPVLRDLLLESRRLYELFSKEESLDFGLTGNGIAVLFNSERGRRALEHEAELSAELGIEARMLGPEDLHRQDPGVEFAARGGLYCPIDMHLEPAVLMERLIGLLGSSRVSLIPDCTVKGWERTGSSITGVITTMGVARAKSYVIASGAWTRDLLRPLGMLLPLEAGKGYSVTVPVPEVSMRIPYILQERRVAITPFANAIRFAGTMEIAGVSESISWPRVEAILDAVPQYFRNPRRPSSSEGTVWAGLRPVSPDGVPYIGRARRYTNLIVATGHAMIGLSLGPVTGRIVADLVRGERPGPDIRICDPNRYD